MIDRKLFFRLIVPLLVIVAIGVILIWPPRLADLMYNLIVEIVGILITVIFVDWRIKSYEGEKWKQVDALIRSDFAGWSLRFFMRATFFLKDGGWNPPDIQKIRSPNKPWGFVIEHASFEDIYFALLEITIEEAEAFESDLESSLNDLLSLYTRHLNRLRVEDIEMILDLESALNSLITEMSYIDNEEKILQMVDGDATRVDAIRDKQIQDTANKFKMLISQSLQIMDKFFPTSKNIR